MVLSLIIFIGFRQIRKFTPAIFPVLYAIMVPLEAAISGTSTPYTYLEGRLVKPLLKKRRKFDHKGVFALAVQKTLGSDVKIDWSRPRLILVA